ncbi:MAG: stage II sporulation protein M [Candidatus ainarchaeum sp.]|nr:stage II sporulation protein M [Candidatus ainarchaeum sp.]MDD3976151.1 stage II sporulation protein M [Candidatus ainarchaeum sp.]
MALKKSKMSLKELNTNISFSEGLDGFSEKPKKKKKNNHDYSKAFRPKKHIVKNKFLEILDYIKSIPERLADDLPRNLKSLYFAILGTMVGFCFAILLFPNNPGVFAVFLTTLFLAPFIQKQIRYNELLVGRTERVESKGITLFKFKPSFSNKIDLSFKQLYYENKEILSVYLNFFLGIFLVVISLVAFIPQEYSSSLFSSNGWNDSLLPSKDIGFSNQSKQSVFLDIFVNNFSVMLVALIIALVFPLGAILIIVWNAVYWGVVFTQYSLTYALFYQTGFFAFLIPLLLSVLPHMILEIISYFLGAMSGNLLSVGISKEKIESDRFINIIKYCFILLAFAIGFLFVGVFTEVYIFDILKNFFFSLF